MLERYDSPITLANVANIANLTTGHFADSFTNIPEKSSRPCLMKFVSNMPVVICVSPSNPLARLR